MDSRQPYLRLSDETKLEQASLIESSGEPWRTELSNLDRFLTRVYQYFYGKGFLTIILSQTVNLLYAVN